MGENMDMDMEENMEFKITTNKNYLCEGTMKICDGNNKFGYSAIDLETKIKASAILDQIVPARKAFILINEHNNACIASSMGESMKDYFSKELLSLIDLYDIKDSNGEGVLKFPLFYKSSELKNIKSMDESDYYKQSELKEVIPENDIHFVDIDEICNQVIKETGMKHLILILEFCRQDNSFLITSNTMEEEDAIAITKSKCNNPYYTRTPSVTKESEELYKKFGNHIFKIPRREGHVLCEQVILQYKHNFCKEYR